MAELIDRDELLKKAVTIPGPSGKSVYSVVFTDDIINTKAIEPITENCIACKYDETEKEDGEHCKKCLAGDNQFELDNEFVNPTIKNDLAHNLCDSCKNIGCVFQSGIVRTECAFYMPPQLEPDNCGNYVVQDSITKNDSPKYCDRNICLKNEYNNIGCEDCEVTKSQEPKTKNNLAVDCVDRREVINQIFYSTDNSGDVVLGSALRERIEKLPSVTPQEPRWIPVSERLPQESFNSIIGWDDYRKRCVLVQYIDGHFQITGKAESFDIKAWMPLPTKYEG